jgi:hypothetical protein
VRLQVQRRDEQMWSDEWQRQHRRIERQRPETMKTRLRQRRDTCVATSAMAELTIRTRTVQGMQSADAIRGVRRTLESARLPR